MSTPILIDEAVYYEVHDAVPTSALTIPLPEDSSALVQFQAVARRSSNGNTKSWNKIFSCKRASGDASIVGSLTNIIAPIGDLGALTWDITIDTDGENVLVQVKGQTSASVSFYLKVVGLTIQD
jgi:hypothetical protein